MIRLVKQLFKDMYRDLFSPKAISKKLNEETEKLRNSVKPDKMAEEVIWLWSIDRYTARISSWMPLNDGTRQYGILFTEKKQ